MPFTGGTPLMPCCHNWRRPTLLTLGISDVIHWWSM